MSNKQREDEVETACEIMHDAYEAAAVGAGWETQERSRKPWAEVPLANQETMRAAVRALLDSPVVTGDLAMVCDAYGLPHSAVALARHLVNNAEETIGNWKLVAQIRAGRMAAVAALDLTCELYDGPGEEGQDCITAGPEVLAADGCTPCRVRAALGEVPPLPDEHEIIAEALEQAAEEMSTGSGSTTEYWDGVKVQYRLYEESPEDKTPQAWLRARAAGLRD